ncbi:TonB family protein [Sphingomonas ginkgonis]|uniref:TonB family protein n=1 Tax=Sphingomonas ginkgonis TaxID=2315330 RepID=A0A429VDK3_9SPHN|nr:TonB family protein [Sphingomonas ginkgonis]RST32013.1 TonB family protein [Sphingomonas ginkgonis]
MTGPNDSENHYQTLGVSPGATTEEIRSAFLHLFQRHRDRPGFSDPERVGRARRINIAYATLGDPVRRRAYDESIGLGALAAAAPGAAIPADVMPGERQDMMATPTAQPLAREAPAERPLRAERREAAAAAAATPATAATAPVVEEPVETDGRRPWVPVAIAAVLVLLASLLAAYILLPRSDQRGRQVAANDRARSAPATGQPALPGPVASAPPGSAPAANASAPEIASQQGGGEGSIVAAPPSEVTPPRDTTTDAANRTAEGRAREPQRTAEASIPALRPPPPTSQAAPDRGRDQQVASDNAPAAESPSPAPAPAAEPPPPPPARVDRSRAARYAGGGLVDSDNPRGRYAGTVRVLFTVQPNGRVSNCRPTEGSGDRGLDSLTCQLVEDRLRFNPALNADGEPVSSQVGTSYTWGRRPRRR